MFRRTRVELLSVAILPLGLGFAIGGAEDHASTTDALQPPTVAYGPVSFSRQVLPILEAKCGDCHGGETTEVELDLLSYEAVMAGSEYGTVIEAGDADGSLLLEMIVAGEMPQDAPELPADEIAIIRSWIAQGAANN